MTTFDPMAEYTPAQAAEIMSVSETFLVGLIGKAVKANVIKLQPGWKILGSDISRLGKTYYCQIGSEQHYQARLRVDERDRAELRERQGRRA